MQHTHSPLDVHNAHAWLSHIVAIQRDVAHTHNDPQQAMNIIVERTHVLTAAESSVIEMLEGDEMVYRAASGKAADFLGLRLNARGSLSGLCVEKNEILRCDDALTDDRVDKEACLKIGVVSMVVVPLIREQRPIGVLKVFSSKRAAFTVQHITALELLACVLSAALSDALVHDSLRQSEELFRVAMEYSPIGMALVKPDGAWFKVNKSLCEMLGYSEEELLGISFRAVSHPDDIEISIKMRQQMEIDFKGHHYEKRYLHKNGAIVWATLNVSPVQNVDGTLKYIIVQIEDITERKHIEKLKQEFISTVSHELRTPLTSIHGALGLVVGRAESQNAQETAAMIDIAYKNSERLVRIVNDMLDLDKMEACSLEVQPVPIEIDPFLVSAIQANAAYGKKFGIHYVLEEGSAKGFVLADAGRLMQVVTNLLSNAAKFSKPGGQVILRAIASGATMTIEIEDHGVGIPESFRSKLFNKFAQADSSDARKHYGTGLGLSIAKKLVELMHGEIGFRPGLSEGTIFYFTLPMVQQ